MDKEKQMRVMYRVALVSGIFSGVVALLLILNFWHMKQHEPLESRTIEVLVERLADEPNNEELKEEIRSFDLLARKAYFTSRWQVRTGTWLLLAGGLLLAVSLKRYTDLRASIDPPGEMTEDLLKARANAQYWLLTGGGLVLGLAFAAGLLSNDYLASYDRMADTGPSGADAQPVEVIEVFPGESQGGAGTPSGTVTADSAGGDAGQTGAVADGGSPDTSPDTSPETSPEDPSAGSAPAAKAVAFSPEAMKENQATFRGFMGQGISYHTGIPENWNGSRGENVKWKVTLSKPGFNTPVIWGDRIFVSGGDEAARVVACYNRNTGMLLWEREVTDVPGSTGSIPRVTEDTGLAAPTMAVDGTRVYAIFATGNLIAFDLEGNRAWARSLGIPDNHYGHSSSLQVWGNKLIVQYDTHDRGRMLALETSSGNILWDVGRPVQISWSSPMLAEVDGKMQVVTTADPYVSGHDLETGAELWKVEALMGEVGPSAAFDNGMVYATQEYAQTIAIKPGATPQVVWSDDEYPSELASPVAHEGLLFLATFYGVLVCYDGETGEKVWEKELNSDIWSSPMIAEGKLYVMDADGVTHIFRADRTGTLVSQPELGEGGYSLPVFADGNIYLRGGTNTLYCIGN